MNIFIGNSTTVAEFQDKNVQKLFFSCMEKSPKTGICDMKPAIMK